MSIVEGQPAPDFTLPDENGQSISLSDFKGQQVIVYFYPRDNTPGCTKEAVGFTELYEQFSALNTMVIGISPDSANSHQKFIGLYDIPFLEMRGISNLVVDRRREDWDLPLAVSRAQRGALVLLDELEL